MNPSLKIKQKKKLIVDQCNSEMRSGEWRVGNQKMGNEKS